MVFAFGMIQTALAGKTRTLLHLIIIRYAQPLIDIFRFVFGIVIDCPGDMFCVMFLLVSAAFVKEAPTNAILNKANKAINNLFFFITLHSSFSLVLPQ